jgi:hypothetical protein
MISGEFRDFVKLLNENRVKYLVVGGYAVAFHGYPRYTKDFDVWIQPSPENANNLLAALDRFGFGSLGLKTEDFLEEDQIIQLGFPPNRIDILTSLKNLAFNDCYEARNSACIQGLQINFIDIENLKKNKRNTGRTQDLADAENLDR